MDELGDILVLSGYLLRVVQLKEIDRTILAKGGRIKQLSQIAATGWEKYEFLSLVPLLNEEEVSRPGPYRYPLICRTSGPRILILSSHREIVDYLLIPQVPELLPRLTYIPIEIDKLVRDITNSPSQYLLSAAYAKVQGFGGSLKTASFFGDDLANASLFRDNLQLMTFYSCGLRKAEGGKEIIRLGNEGSVSFVFSGPERLLQVQDVIKYLRDRNYAKS